MLRVDTASAVRIVYRGEAPSTRVRYFTRLIQRAMPRAKVMLEPSPGEPGLQSVAVSGQGSEITISRLDPSTLEIKAASQTCRFVVRSVSDEALLNEELMILGPDPAFDAVLS
jgi:hypothetical protein